MGLEADRAARETMTASSRPLTPSPAPVARGPLLLSAGADAGDLLGASDAAKPVAELCLSPDAQTPFLLGIVGPPGSGKSFLARRVVDAIEALSAAAAKTVVGPFLSRVVVAPLDASGVSGDPASALAAAAFAALERERLGENYAAFADEAAHGAMEPRRAAAAAVERHDEIVQRLDAERGARDDVDSKRARIADALLFETPGSRVDSFIRTSRPTIEARLRRFGLAEGDAGANYRELVRDLSNTGAGSQTTLMLRSVWAYRGQTRLLMLAAAAFLIGFLIDRLRGPSVGAALSGATDTLAPVANWVNEHANGLERTVQALIVIGILALVFNFARAITFSTLLLRGLRLLNIDVRERRHELDASAARLERRVLALSAEAEAASKRAEALARRAGGGANVSRAPGPAFLKAADTPAKAAREFFAELTRLMNAPVDGMLSPKRLVFVIDNLEALPAPDAVRLVETARSLLGLGLAAVIACNPDALARSAAGSPTGRAWERGLFQVALDASTLVPSDRERLAARLLTTGPRPQPLDEIDASASALAEPLASGELALLMALAPLTESTPNVLKRFHNAYRLARVGKGSRSIIALSLAALLSPDSRVAKALRDSLWEGGEKYEDPAGPPDLLQASRAARAAEGKPIAKADARAAWESARRYAPADL